MYEYIYGYPQDLHKSKATIAALTASLSFQQSRHAPQSVEMGGGGGVQERNAGGRKQVAEKKSEEGHGVLTPVPFDSSGVLQCVEVCCSVLKCVGSFCNRGLTRECVLTSFLCDCLNLLWCVAVCCSILFCVAACYIQHGAVCCNVLECVADEELIVPLRQRYIDTRNRY